MFGRKSDLRSDVQFFTLFDSKSQSYSNPTFAPNSESMIRELLNLFRDPGQAQNMYLLNAEDFSLFRIGSFDKSTGLLSAHNLEHVANLVDLRASVQPRMQDLGIVPT